MNNLSDELIKLGKKEYINLGLSIRFLTPKTLDEFVNFVLETKDYLKLKRFQPSEIYDGSRLFHNLLIDLDKENLLVLYELIKYGH